MFINEWVPGVAYTLRTDNAPNGVCIRDIFLDMTTAEAQFYQKLTDDQPFKVNSTDIDGHVMSIITHKGECKTIQTLRELGWEVANIFPKDVRGFFVPVDSAEIETASDDSPLPPLKEEKVLTPEDVGSILAPELFDKLRGIWTVSLVPTDLGREYGAKVYTNIETWHQYVDSAVEEDKQSIKRALRKKRRELEKELKATKELLSTFA